MSNREWRPVTSQAPCQACKHIDWCAWAPDGRALRCMRPVEATTPTGMTRGRNDRDGGVIFRFQGDSPPRPRPNKTTRRAGSDARQTLGWGAEAARCVKSLSSKRRGLLAAALGTHIETLAALDAGWAESADLRTWKASGQGWKENPPAGAFTFPERDGAGNVIGVSLRAEDGRKGFPAGAKRGLIVPSAMAELPGPVLIVEGASDVAAFLTLGVCSVGRPSNSGGAEHLAALLADREVIVVGENDQKPDGAWPGKEGAKAVAGRLALSWDRNVRWTLPPAEVKDIRAWLYAQVSAGLNLSDPVACRDAGKRLLHDLEAHAVEAAPEAPIAPVSAYRSTPAGLVWMKPTNNGEIPTPLTNFSAKIISEVVRDDGAEQRRVFTIDARIVRGAPRQFDLPAERFAAMNWPIEHLGVGAILYPGVSTREHTRVAIQLLSTGFDQRVVYTHLGWRKINGSWVYLHGGGAIGANGAVAGVEVDPPGDLSGYSLPEPKVGEAQREAVRASLDLICLSGQREKHALPITIPLIAAVFRAVLGSTDFSIHLAGESGSFKTSMAAVMLSHFGIGFTTKDLPSNWQSTGNALEALAFAAKDVVLVIDDFAPHGTSADVQRLHKEADRILRAAGNGSGRQRLRADGSLRPTKRPRGLILTTGEDVPAGQSLRARMLVVEVEMGAIDAPELSAAQRRAENGVYASAMSGFVMWLAGRLEATQQQARARRGVLRDEAMSGAGHRRTPGIIADLQAGLEVFLIFAKESGAITADQAEKYRRDAWSALLNAADGQVAHQQDSDPVARFFALIASALGSGLAHVASLGAGEPQDPAMWGWRSRLVGGSEKHREEWNSQGECIGWTDGEILYLNPEAAHRVANKAAGDFALGVSVRTLTKRIDEQGQVVERDRDHLTVKINIAGARKRVLALNASLVSGAGPSGQTGQPSVLHDESAPKPGPDSKVQGSRIGAENRGGSGGINPEQRSHDAPAPLAPIAPIAGDNISGGGA